MDKDLKSEVKKRFDQMFGIERLPLFEADLEVLEQAGHSEMAQVLKELLNEELEVRAAQTKGKKRSDHIKT